MAYEPNMVSNNNNSNNFACVKYQRATNNSGHVENLWDTNSVFKYLYEEARRKEIVREVN